MCAEKWNKIAKDGKTDWTGRDVEDWREINKFTWHERNDMTTCDLVPTSIHNICRHLGGVAECKRLENQQKGEKIFDE